MNITQAILRENLADPELEIIDPTPNVHSLFIQFDKRFFWNKLSTVVVRWSKRMYSCAGICRYEGRGGLCDIALSEPLLKLRPRKDLVETLLHEMIHAYLFLSNGDRDRDGHGPNFCKHMYRINKEANLHISIYHSFHDEVNLYRTHWWRCDGPCQHRKPYFGMVRRPINRAPGPSDMWWSSHQTSCGGTFIKIKEPENFKSRSKQKENITKSQKHNEIPNKTEKPNITKYFTNSKVTTLGDINNCSTPKCGCGCKKKEIVVLEKTVKILWPENGKVMDISKNQTNNVIETVRNHWANKIVNNNGQTSKKSLNTERKTNKTEIRIETNINNRLENYFPLLDKDLSPIKSIATTSNGGNTFKKPKIEKKGSVVLDEYVNCPICCNMFLNSEINNHLDICLSASVDKSNNIETVDLTEPQGTSCPVCNKPTLKIEEHLEDCLSSFDSSIPEEGGSLMNSTSIQFDDDEDIDESSVFNSTGTKFPCPCCLRMIEADLMNKHLDECLR